MDELGFLRLSLIEWFLLNSNRSPSAVWMNALAPKFLPNEVVRSEQVGSFKACCD